METFRGQRILVTGAASGMGLQMAQRFDAEGAQLLLVDVNAAGLEAAAKKLGHDAKAFGCDLSKPAEIKALKDKVHAAGGPIDVLINNAGVVHGGAFEHVPDEKDRLMLEVNIQAVHWMTKAFLPDLKAKGKGHVVNMASAAGFLGVPLQVTYCASKWFVIGFSEALRAELTQEGYPQIGVTIVCPSYVDTGMFAGVRAPFLTPMLKPAFVADRVVEAMRNNELYVREPFIVKTTPLLKAVLPRRIFDRVSDVLGVTRSMSTWTGRH